MEIAPKFHEDANNLDQLVPFEECIELHSTGETVVRAPDYLLLTHNGRSFRLLSHCSLFHCSHLMIDVNHVTFLLCSSVHFVFSECVIFHNYF